MMKRAFPAVAALACGLSAFAVEKIELEGVYPPHLQGVATDGTNIFWSQTREIVKTDGKGHPIGTTGRVSGHHGDLCCKDGFVYVAVNRGPFNRETGADSWVYAYRGDDLKFVRKWQLPEAVHGAGGITAMGDRFFVVGGLPEGHEENYVYEYASDFTLVKRHVLKSGWTFCGIQTVDFINGRFVFGTYGERKTEGRKPRVTLVAPADLSSCSFIEGDQCCEGVLCLKGRIWRAQIACTNGAEKYEDRRFSSWLVPAALAAGAAENPPSPTWRAERKKVVSFGWEWSGATPDDLLRHADLIDRSGLDGVGISIGAKGPDGKSEACSAYVADSTFVWTREMFADQLPTLRKATAHPGLAESFVVSLRAPAKRIPWEDDAHWVRVATNMGVLAWFAKKAGFRGLALDPEDYSGVNQYSRHPGDPSWDRLASLARLRGRQVFERVFREYPDAVVLGFWLLSWNTKHIYSHDPVASARAAGDLWPSFVNGILDATPASAKLVDGNEWAYQYEASAGEFQHSALAQRNAVLGLVAPENRDRYRQCLLPGFGIYLESYVNDAKDKEGKDNPYYFAAERGARVAHLERNLAEALRCSGGYVWFWGEGYSWVKYDAKRELPSGQWPVSRTTWEEKLPGLGRIVRACANPEAFLRVDLPQLVKSGAIANVATNDMVKLSKVALYGPDGRKESDKKGENYFQIEDPTAEPGAQYAVVVEGRGEGLELNVFWQRRKGCAGNPWRWFVPGQGIPLGPVGSGRIRGEAVVTVPEGVDTIAVQVTFHPETGREDPLVEKMFVGRVPVK